MYGIAVYDGLCVFLFAFFSGSSFADTKQSITLEISYRCIERYGISVKRSHLVGCDLEFLTRRSVKYKGFNLSENDQGG